MLETLVEIFKTTPDELFDLNAQVQKMFKDTPALYIPEYGNVNGSIPCVNVRIGINPPGRYNPKKLIHDWSSSSETYPIPLHQSYNTLYKSGTVVLKLEWYLCNDEMIPVPIAPNGCKYVEQIFEITPSIWNKLKKQIKQYSIAQADDYVEVDENRLYFYHYDLSDLVKNWNIFSIYKFPENMIINKDDFIISILSDRNRVSSISYDDLRKFLISYISKKVTTSQFQYMYSIDPTILKLGECQEDFSVLFTLYFNQK